MWLEQQYPLSAQCLPTGGCTVWCRALLALMDGGVKREEKMGLDPALHPPPRESGPEACISGTARGRGLEEAGGSGNTQL